MKLSLDDINEMRQELVEALASIPEGQKITIDADILKRLLFVTLTTNDTKNIARIPVWTGEFLRKIDLSKISFDDVIWNPTNEIYLSKKLFGPSYQRIIDYFNAMDRPYHIDLSGTNASINFTKSFVANERYYLTRTKHTESKLTNDIERCNFQGTDLSKSSAYFLDGILCSDLSDSRANIRLNRPITIVNSSLEGLALGDFSISAKSLINELPTEEDASENDQEISILNSNLVNTGLNFRLEKDDSKTKQILGSYIRSGLIAGCYVNEVKIKSALELAKLKMLALNSYTLMKADILANITNQISAFSRIDAEPKEIEEEPEENSSKTR